MKHLILFFILCSCTSIQEKIDNKKVSDITNFFYKECEKIKVSCSKVPIFIKDISKEHPNDGAVCYHGKHILIDIHQWRSYTSLKKEILLLHELGHCALNLPHGKYIMNPELVDESFYYKNKNHLLDELFKSPN